MTIQSTKEQLAALEAQRQQAMLDADTETLGKLLAVEMLYTHSDGQTDEQPAYLQGVRARKWIYRQIECLGQDIQVHGDCAVMTGRINIDVLINGEAAALKCRYLGVWAHKEEGWKMVGWQSTRILT